MPSDDHIVSLLLFVLLLFCLSYFPLRLLNCALAPQGSFEPIEPEKLADVLAKIDKLSGYESKPL